LSGEWDQFDFPCPIGDIYLIPDTGTTWSSTRPIGPYVTKKPVQGCGGAGAFYGAILKLPPLPLGEFDVLMDEGQDGVFNASVDFVLGNGPTNALVVIDALLDQVVDVDGIKAEAANSAGEWRAVRSWTTSSLTAVGLASDAFTAAQLASVTGSMALGFGYMAVAVAGVFLPYAMSYNGAVMATGSELIGGAACATASVYQAIADDPPDSNYTEVVTLDPILYHDEISSEPHLNVTVRLQNCALELSALGTALRRSYEKFLGAEEVTDYGYARLQARAAKDFSDLLIERFATTATVLDSLEVALETAGWADKPWSADEARAIQDRVMSSGFAPEEIDSMIAIGMDSSEVDSLESFIVGADLDSLRDGTMRGWIDSLTVLTSGAIGSYQDLGSDLDEVLVRLADAWTNHPWAAITGLDSTEEGSAVELAANASTDPNGLPLTFAWDLDADGEFDDGSNPLATFQSDSAGSYCVGLQVTNANGLEDVAYRFIAVSEVNRIPRFSMVSPDSVYLKMTDAATLPFGAAVEDPDMDQLTVHWFLDGEEVATGASWSFDPSPEGIGRHHVQVSVDDGSPLSPDNFHTWRVDVEPTGIGVHPQSPIAQAFSLAQNEPNPFRDRTSFRFSISEPGRVRLSIFDAAGRRIATLFDSDLDSGVYTFAWNGRLQGGEPVPPGVYFGRLEGNDRKVVRKLVRLR
jgi:hypothetical protein